MLVYNKYCHTIYRAWQRKLHSTVSNNENRAEIYACLWMLISEKDDNKFLKNENSFLSYWNDREEQFVKYYKEEYKDRAGMYVQKTMLNYMYCFRKMGTLLSTV